MTPEQADATGEPLSIPYHCCPLAYGLHQWPGRKCSRQGGDHVCGACISDVNAPALGFRRRLVEVKA